jgi:uncharacterized protein
MKSGASLVMMIRTRVRLCVCLAVVASAAWQKTPAQTLPTLDHPQPAVVAPGRIEADAPSIPAGELVAPPLRAAPSPYSPLMQTQAPDSLALDQEISQLRSRAMSAASASAPGAVQAGNAAWILGLLYLHGVGVGANSAEAATWFLRAHSLGEPLAAAGLAWCEIDGCTGPPNPPAARRWLVRLRETSPARALYLQWLVDTRMAPLGTAANAVRAGPRTSRPTDRQLLMRAAESGDTQARIELGLALAEANRKVEAMEQFRRASFRSPAAAGNLAILSEQLRKPRGTDYGAGRSAVAATTFATAQRNHRGDGRPANYVEAIRLYRLAQSQGSVEARKMLELIFSRPGTDGDIDLQWMQQLAYADSSNRALVLGSPASRRVLQREPTPLSDLLPGVWRQYLSQNQLAR